MTRGIERTNQDFNESAGMAVFSLGTATLFLGLGGGFLPYSVVHRVPHVVTGMFKFFQISILILGVISFTNVVVDKRRLDKLVQRRIEDRTRSTELRDQRSKQFRENQQEHAYMLKTDAAFAATQLAESTL
ncbi:MAG: hypothetical protein S4CHLAM81_07410 [Chlamydiales bacterium]|nr:hypothetical protein [Chlamydiales bacterium]MCH9635524.1 hypothetical protein [Chlamydiales bacterium]MCH9703733.1 hypothetical protein [Chlamydiota bacterium]